MRTLLNNVMRHLSFRTLSALVIVSGLLFSGVSAAHQQVTIDRVQMPVNPAIQAVIVHTLNGGGYYGQAIKVAIPQPKPQSMQIDRIQLHPGKLVLVGHRIVHQPRYPAPVWLEQVKITIPRQYLSSSWDVRSLQKELDRLGIKIKPKPAPPKPVQISG